MSIVYEKGDISKLENWGRFYIGLTNFHLINLPPFFILAKPFEGRTLTYVNRIIAVQNEVRLGYLFMIKTYSFPDYYSNIFNSRDCFNFDEVNDISRNLGDNRGHGVHPSLVALRKFGNR